jgi:hypothetical protein
MADPVEHLRWHEWARDAWTEKRPARKDMTDREKLGWLAQYCVSYKPSDKFYVITDCLGQVTSEMDFFAALDVAIARFYAEA